MDDFTPIIGQLSGLAWGDNRDQARRWHFPRIRRENPVNFFPYLQFRCGKTDCQESREEIRIPSTYLTQ
jgi:hypothetical protein